MIGVVLCGGESSRMGTDKGLLPVDHTTWAARTVEKIAALGLPAVLSVNPVQHPGYAAHFSSIPLVTDSEAISIRGPLAGVLSVHRQYPSQDLLVLACDMPMLESSLLQYLVNTALMNPGFDAYAFKRNEEWEPLCSIYSAHALSVILQQYEAGQLIKHSMKNMLEQVNTFSIPVSAEQQVSFTNINTPDELKGR